MTPPGGKSGGTGGGKKGGAGGKKGGKAKSGARGLTTRVRTARGRTTSSTRWLERQLNDPYVAEAQRLGYRSRAAFKLIQLDDKFHFLKSGARVIDLGAAPGGWTQVAVARVKADGGGRGQVVGLDLQEMSAIPGATLIQGDFMADDAPETLKAAIGGAPDVVLSDMAAPATGHAATDHMRIMALCETAYEFALEVLAPGGTFIAKVLAGGTETELLARMKQDFATVRHAKPAASRSDSKELYLVAVGFRRKADDAGDA